MTNVWGARGDAPHPMNKIGLHRLLRDALLVKLDVLTVMTEMGGFQIIKFGPRRRYAGPAYIPAVDGLESRKHCNYSMLCGGLEGLEAEDQHTSMESTM